VTLADAPSTTHRARPSPAGAREHARCTPPLTWVLWWSSSGSPASAPLLRFCEQATGGILPDRVPHRGDGLTPRSGSSPVATIRARATGDIPPQEPQVARGIRPVVAPCQCPRATRQRTCPRRCASASANAGRPPSPPAGRSSAPGSGFTHRDQPVLPGLGGHCNVLVEGSGLGGWPVSIIGTESYAMHLSL
jgi:hypothetical protein